MNKLLYIIRFYHFNIPVSISKSSSTRNTFVQTRTPVPLQNVEDGSSLWFLRQRSIITDFVRLQYCCDVPVVAGLPSSVSKWTCMIYLGIINYK
jgi:hypothetical protein